MTSEGQSPTECVCGRPTYGAPQCRRCSALERALETDRHNLSPPADTAPTDTRRKETNRTESFPVRAVEQPIDAKTRLQQIRNQLRSTQCET
jgi:hypothetical protein